jgi:hypothetical protein
MKFSKGLRCKSEMESNWRGIDRSAQQNQDLVQARWNGKATTSWLNNTFVWGEKSNEIAPWAESISQGTPFL